MNPQVVALPARPDAPEGLKRRAGRSQNHEDRASHGPTAPQSRRENEAPTPPDYFGGK